MLLQTHQQANYVFRLSTQKRNKFAADDIIESSSTRNEISRFLALLFDFIVPLYQVYANIPSASTENPDEILNIIMSADDGFVSAKVAVV